MAILGFHIVLSLISASALQKLSAHYSLGRRILSHGLKRYYHPTDEELKQASSGNAANGKSKSAARNRKKERETQGDGGFIVDKNVPVTLDVGPVTAVDVLQLPFYVEYRWLIDLAFSAVCVYSISEFWCYITYGSQTSEINLSIVWFLLVIGAALKCLTSLSSLFFLESKDTGERSIVLCVGAIYLLLAMCALLMVDRLFDVGLHGAYANFSSTANQWLTEQNIDIQRAPQSSVFLYLFFSILFAFMSGMLVFPSFRYAKMYIDGISDERTNVFVKLLLHISFFSPLVAISLWLRPVSSYLLTRPTKSLTVEQLESLRLLASLAVVLLRVILARRSIQAYLNIAKARMTNIQSQAGRINSRDLQRHIARIFTYTCVAAAQYFVPVVLTLSLTCLLKTTGSYHWLMPFGFPDYRIPSLVALVSVKEPGVLQSSQLRQGMLHLTSLFNPFVCRALFSILLISNLLINYSLNLIGVVYNLRFATN